MSRTGAGLRIESEERGDVTVVALSGDFDFHDVTSASDKIGVFIDEGAQRLVFDLKGLKFISSGGIGYIIQTAKRLRKQGGELVLACPPAAFGWVVQTLGIDRIVKIFPNDREAVEYFRTRTEAPPRPL